MNVTETTTQLNAKITTRPRLTESSRRKIAFFLMIAPWFIVFLVFQFYPMVYGFYLSFTNYLGFNIHNLKFVGLQNYKNVFADSNSMYALGRTLFVAAIVVPLQTFIGLFLAILLNRSIRGVGFFRTIYYLPSIVPIVSIAMMWKIMYSTNNGIINAILKFFHIPAINWLDYDHVTMSMILVFGWMAGGGLLINLAGLKGISKELYEAASMDGATSLQRTFSITLPLMTPLIFYNVVMGIIHAMQVFILPVLLNGNEMNSVPLRPNYLLVVHAFQQVMTQRYAYGMALLWIMFVFMILLTIVVFASSRYWVYYEKNQE